MQLTTEIKQYELSENKASQLEAVFIPMLDMLKPMEADYNSIIADAENGIDEDITARATWRLGNGYWTNSQCKELCPNVF